MLSIVRRRLVGLLVLCAIGPLAACVMEGGGSAPTSVSVGDQMTVAGPSGYCVDTSASRTGDSGAFVLLGSCASLSQSLIAARPKYPAILTASVSGGGPDAETFKASFPSMAKFLSSTAGRAALSRNGKAASVEIAQIGSAGDAMTIRATDTAAAPGQNVEPEYWRALMTIKGQIVTLTVMGLKDKPLSSEVKRALLDAFIARVRAVNAG
ncbi:MAG: hypothetical protein WAT77_04315 [Paracoccaceae bacterium]